MAWRKKKWKEEEDKSDVGETYHTREGEEISTVGNEVVARCAVCRCAYAERAGSEGARAGVALMHAIAVSHAEMKAAVGRGNRDSCHDT